jgi:hypothetical protein
VCHDKEKSPNEKRQRFFFEFSKRPKQYKMTETTQPIESKTRKKLHLNELHYAVKEPAPNQRKS